MTARTVFSRPERIGFVIAAVLVPSLLACYVCLSYVEPGESVIKACDGDLSLNMTVWRAPENGGLHWDGLCRTATYQDDVEHGFRDVIEVEGTRVTIRGTYIAHFPQGADAIRELYSEEGSQDDLMDGMVDQGVHKLVREVAHDPSWHQPKGGMIKRELKNALEYGIRRISPTGWIWSTPEVRHALQAEIQDRMDHAPIVPGCTVTFQLGFVTER